MEKNYIYIANWKMYWSLNQTLEFATRHYDNLITLASTPHTSIVLCPSTLALYPLAEMFKQTNVHIGAQDCSDHQTGAYTGQVAAAHLQELGAAFCIIGHSERRKFCFETNTMLAYKILHCIQASITPILCIGETDQDHKEGKTLAVLEQQLQPIFDALHQQAHAFDRLPFIIAYEPVWAIGNGVTPSPEQLETIFAWLATTTIKRMPTVAWKPVYGGSVSAKNIAQLKGIPGIDGFLIGGASLNFQDFENIVKSPVKRSL